MTSSSFSRWGTPTDAGGGGAGRTLWLALPPSPSTSVYRLADRNSAMPCLCVFDPVWVFGCGRGAGVQAADAVFHPLPLSKNGNVRNQFFCFLTSHNDQLSYVKHFLDSVYVLSPYLCVWMGARRWGTTCSCSFPDPGAFGTFFLYFLTIHNDQISYPKHVLDLFMCFSPYLGVRRGN